MSSLLVYIIRPPCSRRRLFLPLVEMKTQSLVVGVGCLLCVPAMPSVVSSVDLRCRPVGCHCSRPSSYGVVVIIVSSLAAACPCPLAAVCGAGDAAEVFSLRPMWVSCCLPYRARRGWLRRSRPSGVLFVLACLAMGAVSSSSPLYSTRRTGRCCGRSGGVIVLIGFSSAGVRFYFSYPFYSYRLTVMSAI